jgi:hypothetical protein
VLAIASLLSLSMIDLLSGEPLLSLYSGEEDYKGRNSRGIFPYLSYFIKLLWLQA